MYVLLLTPNRQAELVAEMSFILCEDVVCKFALSSCRHLTLCSPHSLRMLISSLTRRWSTSSTTVAPPHVRVSKKNTDSPNITHKQAAASPRLRYKVILQWPQIQVLWTHRQKDISCVTQLMLQEGQTNPTLGRLCYTCFSFAVTFLIYAWAHNAWDRPKVSVFWCTGVQAIQNSILSF